MDTPESLAAPVGEAGQAPDHTPTADQRTPTAETFSLSSAVDAHTKSYEGYDPEIHAANDDGTPKLKADGTYAKKRGRKAGKGEPLPDPDNVRQNLAPIGTADPAMVVPPPEPQRPRMTAEASARMITNALINCMVMIFGAEWEPTDKEEAEGIKVAWKDYFDASGSPDIPPGLILIISLGIYAAPRIRHDNTKSKLSKAWIFIKHKIGL